MAGIHVVYNGNTRDLTFEELFPQDRLAAIGFTGNEAPASSNLTEDQVKRALAQHFDVGVGEFGDHKVEMNPNGNITVRPDTPFGG